MNPAGPDLDIDIGRLARMGAFDDPVVSGIIERFLDTLDGRFGRMEAASADGDSDQLIHLAHELHGSAANCGFPRLAGACNALDRNPLSFDVASFRSLAGRARNAWEHSRKF